MQYIRTYDVGITSYWRLNLSKSCVLVLVLPSRSWSRSPLWQIYHHGIPLGGLPSIFCRHSNKQQHTYPNAQIEACPSRCCGSLGATITGFVAWSCVRVCTRQHRYVRSNLTETSKWLRNKELAGVGVSQLNSSAGGTQKKHGSTTIILFGRP